jgi:hypothetical protein
LVVAIVTVTLKIEGAIAIAVMIMMKIFAASLTHYAVHSLKTSSCLRVKVCFRGAKGESGRESGKIKRFPEN